MQHSRESKNQINQRLYNFVNNFKKQSERLRAINAYARKEVVYDITPKASIFSHDVEVNIFALQELCLQ